MNTGAHDAGAGFTQSVGTNAARGIAVILAAVAAGVILMWLGYSNSTVVADAGDSESTLVAGDDGDDGAEAGDGSADGDTSDDGATADNGTTTTPTTAPTTASTAPAPPPTHAPAEVNVLAANAAENKKGIAGRTAAIVEQAGFNSLKATDANTDQETAIQYAEGYESDAVAVAELFGLDASVVMPFPDSLNVDDPGTAHIIVIVGLDGKIDV